MFFRLESLNLPGDMPRHPTGRVKRIKPIQFPEDRLVESYYAKNPDVSSLAESTCCGWASLLKIAIRIVMLALHWH